MVVAAAESTEGEHLALLPSAQRLDLLPLSPDAVGRLLDGYGRDDLRAAVDRWAPREPLLLALLSRPDLLAAWAQTPRRREVERPSLATVLGPDLRRRLSEAASVFDHQRVVVPVLGRLAYELLRNRRTAVEMDDDLLTDLSRELDRIARLHHRRRNVLPADWTAETFLRLAARSSVVDLTTAEDGTEHVGFRRGRYADWFAAQWATGHADPDVALRNLVAAGAERAVVQIVDAGGEHDSYVDAVAGWDADMAVRVWLASRNRRPSATVQKDFDSRVAALRSRSPAPGQSFDARAAPRDRLRALDGSTPISVLLDAAQDADPLVRGAAEYLLLHSGTGTHPPYLFGANGRMAISVHGAGRLVVGGHPLMVVPAGVTASVALSVRQQDVDPFASPDAVAYFVPPPATAVAASLLTGGAGGDWLQAAATLYIAALTSREVAVLAGTSDLGTRADARATDCAALAAVMAADLGLAMPGLPPVPATDADAAWDGYGRLRRTFVPRAPGAGSRRTRSRGESRLDASQSVDDVVGSTFTLSSPHLTVQSRHGDGYYPADRGSLTAATSVGRVLGGSFSAVDIDILQGGETPLPISLRVRAAVSVRQVAAGRCFGIRVGRIAGRHPNAEFSCSMSIDSLSGHGSVGGVVIGTEPW
ncbi:hypothetical protein AB0J80_31135 [Actinoplanes sp. NPDC049548]|uniref:hypothetical protein n=1 Tax=Actinoplanes sp. NPDC049548 TaxID=3155152 RepID=UPI00342734FC